MRRVRRYRRRARAALQAARSVWYLGKLDPDNGETGCVYVRLSKELLDSGDPSVPHLAADDARKRMLGLVRHRMGIKPS